MSYGNYISIKVEERKEIRLWLLPALVFLLLILLVFSSLSSVPFRNPCWILPIITNLSLSFGICSDGNQHLFHVQWHCVASLTSSLVEVFIPYKLANTTNEGFYFPESQLTCSTYGSQSMSFYLTFNLFSLHCTLTFQVTASGIGNMRSSRVKFHS